MIYQIVSNRFPDWMLYEALFRHPELMEDSLAREHTEHSMIVKALTDGNPELASQTARDHVLSLGRDIEEMLGIPIKLIKAKEYPARH
jgi:DNA-binding GntR family transcriptional regulator